MTNFKMKQKSRKPCSCGCGADRWYTRVACERHASMLEEYEVKKAKKTPAKKTPVKKTTSSQAKAAAALDVALDVGYMATAVADLLVAKGIITDKELDAATEEVRQDAMGGEQS